MQRWLIGILVLLVLFLAAMNVRLSSRIRLLEERLAAAERPSRRPVEAAAVEVAPAPKRNLLDARDPRLDEPAPKEEQRLKSLTLTPAPAPPLPLNPSLQDAEPVPGRRAGFLGIMGEDVPGGGVKINGVVPQSVASGSGLIPEDVILEVNGERMTTLATLSARIREAGEGSPLSLRIRRNGTEFYQGVQLGSLTR